MLCIECWKTKNPLVSNCEHLQKHLIEDNTGFVVLIDFVPQATVEMMQSKANHTRRFYHSVKDNPESWWIVLKKGSVAYGEACPVTIALIDLVDFYNALKKLAPWLTPNRNGLRAAREWSPVQTRAREPFHCHSSGPHQCGTPVSKDASDVSIYEKKPSLHRQK